MNSTRSALGMALCALLLAATLPCSGDPLDQWNWRRPLPPGDRLAAVTAAKGIFVAVGEHGAVATSADGVHWNYQQTGADIEFKGIAYGNGSFVAVGWVIIESTVFGAIFVSGDGIEWTPAILGLYSGLEGVAFGNGRFVAAGRMGTILTSTDGFNWSFSNDSGDYSDFQGAYFGNGQFIVDQGNGAVLVSQSGTHWVEYPVGWLGFVGGIFYGNGRYVGTGTYGKMLVSTNGVDWTLSDALYPAICVGYGHGKFIAHDGATSMNGIDWTPSSGGFDGYLKSAVWKNGLFVAVGTTSSYGTSAFVSSTGEQWQPVNSEPFNLLAKVANRANKFVAVGAGGTIFVWLTGGKLTQCDSKTSADLSAVAYGNGLFVAGGATTLTTDGYSPTILISRNGRTWAQVTNVTSTFPYPFYLTGIASRKGLCVAIGDNGAVLTSEDGTTWTAQKTGIDNRLFGIACGRDGRFVAVGEGGPWNDTEYPDGMFSSLDGTNWTRINHASGETLLDVTYGNGQFVAVGSSDILTSPDGITWSNHTGVGYWLNSVTYGNRQFVAVGSSGGGGLLAPIASSTDGINWQRHFSGTGQNLNGIAFGDHVFAVVGEVILESKPVTRRSFRSPRR